MQETEDVISGLLLDTKERGRFSQRSNFRPLCQSSCQNLRVKIALPALWLMYLNHHLSRIRRSVTYLISPERWQRTWALKIIDSLVDLWRSWSCIRNMFCIQANGFEVGLVVKRKKICLHNFGCCVAASNLQTFPPANQQGRITTPFPPPADVHGMEKFLGHFWLLWPDLDFSYTHNYEVVERCDATLWCDFVGG